MKLKPYSNQLFTIAVILVLCLLTNSSIAQSVRIDEPIPDQKLTKQELETTIFTSVEKLPEFPGGYIKFQEYIKANLKYPVAAADVGGARVNITFVVNRDGSLTDMKAIGRIPHPAMEQEALRVMKASPKWKPGESYGKKVRVQYTVPIVFTTKE
ncbi:energy transducer TonB [Mucilaginibacter terrae]|uniref:TonB family protein n=1 Tax=Mucilaginibacter terrae TaxID=1955052 RepID=A0ABU3GXY7_9SPHI|nr:energy transducer TonB [Mucilaginibacter terrae]MDT3404633.1 TonB family protein [Mucilaginibacter terrae]